MIHNMFNEDLLTRCNKPQFKGQHVEPVPILTIINEKEEYEVKEVQKHRKRDRGTQYLVHWKSYRDEHNQWIVESWLFYVKEVIEDYWMKCLS